MTKLSIRFLTGTEPRSLELYIKKQCSEFFKTNSEVKEADVKLSREFTVDNFKVCEIYLKTNSKNIFTIQRSSSFEVSLTKALQKLNEQLTKIHDQTHDKAETISSKQE